MTAEACQCEGIDETVTRHLDLKKFKALLPKLFSCLSEKEGMVLKLKFFEELTGVEIAKRLNISEGRVSQLSRTALAKLEKLYLFAGARRPQEPTGGQAGQTVERKVCNEVCI